MRRSLCGAYGLEFLASAWFLRCFGSRVRSQRRPLFLEFRVQGSAIRRGLLRCLQGSDCKRWRVSSWKFRVQTSENERPFLDFRVQGSSVRHGFYGVQGSERGRPFLKFRVQGSSMRRNLCGVYGLGFLASAWFLRRFGSRIRSAGLSSWFRVQGSEHERPFVEFRVQGSENERPFLEFRVQGSSVRCVVLFCRPFHDLTRDPSTH